MMEYIIYGTSSCPYCKSAKDLLDSKELPYTYTDLMEVTPHEQKVLQETAGKQFRTVPQIFLNDGEELKYIGGFTDLKETFED